MSFNYFTENLLRWYPLHRRDLPWRETNSPYIIWLSEIILQQTRVAQGLPYFHAFIERFPTVVDLANAPQEEILRTWQGLGYYSRARNLHSCAQSIVNERNGEFPDNYKALLKLKGVGPYTAAAIASFAFKEQVAVLDGNVFRVLSRYFGLDLDISSNNGKKAFDKLANKLIPKESPDQYNQAIMEFGALQCVPKNPTCNQCPLSSKCYAFQNALVNVLPVNEKKVKIKSRYFLYFHIQMDDFTVVRKREEKDIWQGLIDFPLEEYSSPEDIINIEPDSLELPKELNYMQPHYNISSEKPFKHLLTHQRIFASFVNIKLKAKYREALEKWVEKNNYALVNESSLESLGKPKLIVHYLNQKN